MFFKRLMALVGVFCIGVILAAALFTRAISAEGADGEALFNANCSACHVGGNNVIIAQKTLKQDALEKYEMNSLEAIQTQIVNGKNAMPSFKDRLTDEEVAAIATYVLKQSESGW